jgi:uncharacterized protein
VRSEEPLSREQVEEKFGTTGGFRLPTLKKRGALLWIIMGLLLAGLALAGGLPGGGSRVNLRDVLKPFPAVPGPDGRPPGGAPGVVRDLQQTWKELFGQAGIAFHPPKVVLFDRSGRSDCGAVSTGVYYCDYDETLVVDRGSTPYQVAHGYAHHLQSILNITRQVRRAERASASQARDFWLSHELQADCLAGVWAHSAYRNPAAARVDGAPIPTKPDHFADSESWNAPTAERRAIWFQRGFAGGKPAACDTFSRDG